MIKVFISQPMNNLTDKEILDKRTKAKEKLAALNVGEQIELIDSFFTDYDGKPVQFLGKSIIAMGEADLVVFLPGWNRARGCRMEEAIANAYGLECVYIS